MTRSSVPGMRNVLRICLRIWLPPGGFNACSSTLVCRRPGFRGCFAFGHKGREAAQKARKRVFLRLLVVRHFRPIALLLAQYTVGRHAPDFVLTFSRFFSSVYSFAAAFSYRCAASSGAVRSLFRSPNLTLSVHSTGLLLSSTDGRRKRDQPVRRVLTIDGLNAALALVVTEH